MVGANGTETAGEFQKNSLGWQLQQVQQRVEEFIERLLFGNDPNRKPAFDWSLPDWLLEGLFWMLVIALVGWAGWQLYKLLNPYLFPAGRLRRSPAPSTNSQPQALTISEWLGRSRTAQQQGDYREACRCLYMAMLQNLNDKELIPQQLSRTDGEYLHLVQTLNPPQPYQTLIRTHEQFCFSDAAISSDTFERCWQAYQEIQP
ncbi:DUF4129 domain-containing protein [Leptolyngbya sp. FACHB-541]|uniref:DUF4129 domain-containing protein n=1 Tax=Leptolyngbya sp. FACHB-541 TaxID=2692810 RepID=UPI0016879076|nr:DUF4129 domain-containing protein [Leptolyngbya sp. FACHB-541]MBD1998085.1 DUF4129 domain-containing protein [Leptolyngbya sp. FACHB-541]